MSALLPASCSGCGGVLLPGAAFCQRCGHKVGPSCHGCGHALEVGFAFCPRCGLAQAPAPPPPAANDNDAQAADRRLVTVLFADLTGFTSLAEGLDPETLRAFQNALFEVMAASVARYDGFVEKFVGDAVMAVFGAPRAHEDDPVRAVDAALDMLAGIGELSHRWAPRLARAVTLHIGVHTGAVVAGSLGSGAGGTYAVTGDTVNTAARLLNAAEPGSVLVSAATQALTQHRFDFAPPAELALRGKAQPMRVFQVLGLRSAAAQASPRGLADLGLAAPLVGRDMQLAQLMAAFDAAQAGRGQLVCVTGEAGAGKSRLLAEFFARLQSQRADELAATSVRRASCSSLGEPTYGAFGALFRDAYRVEQSDSLAVAQHKLQEGLRALGADASEADAVSRVLNYLLGMQEDAAPRPGDIEPEQLQRQIVLAARALLERRLATQPLMIVLDDVHWADTASIDLLVEVLDQLADRPLMLMLCQRPDARALHAAQAGQFLVALEPLGAADTQALVDQLLGATGDAGLAPVRQLVTARAGGNPLFVEEIVRSLAGAGQLLQQGGQWRFTAADDGTPDVPPTLYGLLLSRIDRLGADERRTLQEAAVLGADFDAGLLRSIAGAPAAATDAALQRLAAAELLRPHGEARWRFTHALLHEVAYQNLLLARRSELHARVGRALEVREAQGGPDRDGLAPRRLVELEALGHHWSLSPDKLRGARYLLAAGDWARGVYANEDAMRHYSRAMRTLDEADSTADEAAAHLQLDAHERLADMQALAGQREEALKHYETIRESLSRQGAEPVRAARVLRKIGGLHWEAGDRERAATCFNEGLAQLGEQGDAIERAHLFQELGRLAFRAGDSAGALAWARRALDEVPMAPADGEHDAERARAATIVRAEASNTLGVALARLGRPEEAVKEIEHSVAQAEALDLLQAACRGYTNLGVLYATLDPQRSIETCLRGLETARKVGDLAFQSRLYANLAVAYCALTNRCEAEGIAAAQTAVQLDRRLGLVDHLAVPLIVLGQIHQCHGDHPRALAAYQEALQLAEQVAEPQLLFPCYDGLATLYLDAGRPGEAEVWLAKAQALCEGAGLEPDALMVLPFLC
ncbi:adenylate/guanylate cyclase domain-containing protein [Variovorax sp. OV329]|uniref:adenylate/guanylate cyclase domain-containing protein n=1 Tax=Variovorax sp. OV329 TaxID=1882825 RepID=UPI0008E219B3|nr:adenylate/guanylate cyclase domain-containing protein [Variovorax sp. OV329]SFN28128.1 adenylate cyclase [Variovorax sp. OV329]